MIRTYSELIQIDNFKSRYLYLQLHGVVGAQTFGFDRYLNQLLYTSSRWRKLRDKIIIRDAACDLAMPGYEVQDLVVVHHLNAITVDDILNENAYVFDPEFLICTSANTHRAIHYGDENLLPTPFVERFPGDTTLWRT